jgi:hypothetical protein
MALSSIISSCRTLNRSQILFSTLCTTSIFFLCPLDDLAFFSGIGRTYAFWQQGFMAFQSPSQVDANWYCSLTSLGSWYRLSKFLKTVGLGAGWRGSSFLSASWLETLAVPFWMSCLFLKGKKVSERLCPKK